MISSCLFLIAGFLTGWLIYEDNIASRPLRMFLIAVVFLSGVAFCVAVDYIFTEG